MPVSLISVTSELYILEGSCNTFITWRTNNNAIANIAHWTGGRDITDKSATNVLATTIKHKSPDKNTKSFNLFGKFRAVYYFTLLLTEAYCTVVIYSYVPYLLNETRKSNRSFERWKYDSRTWDLEEQSYNIHCAL